jgi:hypothetical protein
VLLDGFCRALRDNRAQMGLCVERIPEDVAFQDLLNRSDELVMNILGNIDSLDAGFRENELQIRHANWSRSENIE